MERFIKFKVLMQTRRLKHSNKLVIKSNLKLLAPNKSIKEDQILAKKTEFKHLQIWASPARKS